ncbi:protein-cysteine N-palmitoyltransferase Rasp isoform X1 [Rhagoletis pomonella]|uniref:protein-cysteine N-palmitoyltransferase Rasp isoform X1 n=1 Tax=Rhagoletis pomonella TaxID=28610 RepID=UPI001785F24D|nr:protein-cysteine N-palmitoyltransferase Rasp isoform X1 [Rhagoletis pomonella]
MDESKGFHFYRRELFLYFGVYFAYLIYGFWTLFGLREELQQHSGHTRDPYNYELDIFNNYVRVNWHWYILHAVISTTSRFFISANKMGMVYAFVSVPSLLTILPLKMAAFVLAMLCNTILDLAALL